MNQIIITALIAITIAGTLGYSDNYDAYEPIEIDVIEEEVIVSDIDSFELAVCLDESEAEFFGAYWCPHCADQKSLFGDNAEILPYIECAEDGENPQTEYCTEMGITAYPTWIFSDGSQLIGTQNLESLNEAAGCGL